MRTSRMAARVTSGSSSLAPMRFCDLNDDILFDIFKYFPLKRRVVMERCCRRWAEILQQVWRSQKALQFGFFPGKPETFKLNPNDICYKRNFNISILRLLSFNWKRKKEFKKWPKVAYKCENLRTLDLAGTAWDDQKVYVTGAEMAKACPKIEHFVVTKDELYLVSDYSKRLGSTNRINCIELNAGWKDGDEDYENPYPSFESRLMICLAACQNLTRLYVCSACPKLLERYVPRLKELRLNVCSSREIEIIANQGKQLEKLVLPSTTITLYQLRELCENLSQLKHVSFKSELKNIRFLRCLKNLTEVVWCQSSEEDEDEEKRRRMERSFNDFCAANGKRLKSLTLYVNTKVREHFLAHLVELCPRLERLKINMKGSKEVKVEYPPIQKLTQLKYLNISFLPMTNAQATEILKECVKLREVYMDYCSLLTTEITDRFIEFGRKHPKRVISVSLIEKKKAGKGPVRKTHGNSRVTFDFEDPFDPTDYEWEEAQLI